VEMNARSPQLRSSQARASIQDGNNLRRIAMFLMRLSVQVSADVMSQLTPDESRRIGNAIAELELIDPRIANEALHELQSMRANGEALAKLGSHYAWHFVSEALRSEPAQRPAGASGEVKARSELFRLPLAEPAHSVDGH